MIHCTAILPALSPTCPWPPRPSSRSSPRRPTRTTRTWTRPPCPTAWTPPSCRSWAVSGRTRPERSVGGYLADRALSSSPIAATGFVPLTASLRAISCETVLVHAPVLLRRLVRLALVRHLDARSSASRRDSAMRDKTDRASRTDHERTCPRTFGGDAQRGVESRRCADVSPARSLRGLGAL